VKLQELQKNWDEFGRTDPFWAILSAPDKRGQRWDVAEFFHTGQTEIARVLDEMKALALPARRRTALDFGCGVGRLTQALADYFDECWGVDIAPSMIRVARQHNHHGRRCRYAVNAADNLSLFPDQHFDLIYSNLVLQHMAPPYSRRYIEEFVRVLAPGGAAVFQIPSEQRQSQALPAAAARARVEVEQAPSRARAGVPLLLQVRVQNLSSHSWPNVFLGNHWLDAGGRLLVNDDGRAYLPTPFAPQAEANAALLVTPPEPCGDYLLELDLADAEGSWFKQRGYQPIRIPVRVDAAHGLLVRLYHELLGVLWPHRPTPRMEMHGIPPEQVLALLDRPGLQVVNVVENHMGGPNWRSYRYCITRSK
jgi:SAM-dependent methyltransferase